ncbi:MAG: hypothetical protein STSR0004_20940 [Peptococcaceae bacterium]
MALISRKIDLYEIENLLNKMFSPQWLRDIAAKIIPANEIWHCDFRNAPMRTICPVKNIVFNGFSIRAARRRIKLP